MSEQKRPTVIVNCAVPNGVQLRRHSPAVHQFAPQMPDGEGVMLKAGQNPGVDKEWFDGWREENQNLSLVTGGLITAIDEDPDNPGQPKSKEATMDHDVMHRHVQGLVKFKDRFEKVLEWAEAQMTAAADAPAVSGETPTADQIAEVRKDLADLGEHLTTVQQAYETMATLAQNMTEMRNWFAENHEALDLLLSVGDEQPDTASGTVNTGAQDVTGAAAEKPATEAPVADPVAQAAPQVDQAAGSTG